MNNLKNGYDVQKFEGSTPNHILLNVILVSCTLLRKSIVEISKVQDLLVLCMNVNPISIETIEINT